LVGQGQQGLVHDAKYAPLPPFTTSLTPDSTDKLDKTKVTGVEQVDTAQDGVNNLVAGQLGKGGIAQPVGDAFSKEGINRAERKGADDKGNYAPGPLNSVAKPVAEGAKGAGGYVGGLFGGK
jgi:hypothetical protein